MEGEDVGAGMKKGRREEGDGVMCNDIRCGRNG